MPIEDMKQLRLPGHGNIREQAINVREHRVVISCLQALMSTTLCGSVEVLRLSAMEASSAHFRYLVNPMARISACKPPESVTERFNLVSSTHHDWGTLDPSQDFDTDVENWKMSVALIPAFRAQTHIGVLAGQAFLHLKATLRSTENDGEEVKYDGLLTKAEVADATARDVRAVAEANCALLNSRRPTLEALLALCEDGLIREICLTLGASEDIPPSMALAEYPVADVYAKAVELGSPPPSLEARVLATEVRTLASSPPSSVDNESYVKYMGNVDSALSRLAVLRQPAYTRQIVEAEFIQLFLSAIRNAESDQDYPAKDAAQAVAENRFPRTLAGYRRALDNARKEADAGDSVLIENALIALLQEASSPSTTSAKGKSGRNRRGKQSSTSTALVTTLNVTEQVPYSCPPPHLDLEPSSASVFLGHTASPPSNTTLEFILDTGCASPVVVPDEILLDGSTCNSVRTAPMTAFDGRSVPSHGSGTWCGLSALVCNDAPPLLNPMALCQMFGCQLSLTPECAEFSRPNGDILLTLHPDHQGLLRVEIATMRRLCLAFRAADGVVHSSDPASVFLCEGQPLVVPAAGPRSQDRKLPNPALQCMTPVIYGAYTAWLPSELKASVSESPSADPLLQAEETRSAPAPSKQNDHSRQRTRQPNVKDTSLESISTLHPVSHSLAAPFTSNDSQAPWLPIPAHKAIKRSFNSVARDAEPSPHTSNVFALLAPDDDIDPSSTADSTSVPLLAHLEHMDDVCPRPVAAIPKPRAARARMFHQLLGFPMSSTVENTILSPSNTGLPVTVDDMRAVATAHGDAIDIRDASNLKHKGTSHASQKEPPEYPGCHLYADFLPHPGLQSHTLIAADYFGVTLAAYLPDKTLNSQIDATMELCAQFNALSGRTSGVRSIAFDGESACKGAAFRSSIAVLGVHVLPGDPTYHCPRAERAIQEIKTMAARIRATLVWKLETVPRAMHYLVQHCCHMRAHFVRPSAVSQGVSPYHELTGTTRGWRGCSLLPFGCAAYALRTSLEMRTAKAKGEHPPLRGEPGILLGFPELAGTGRLFYKFCSGEVVVRRNFTAVDMPTALRTIPPSMVVEDSFMLQRAIVNSQLSEVIDSNSALVSPADTSLSNAAPGLSPSIRPADSSERASSVSRAAHIPTSGESSVSSTTDSAPPEWKAVTELQLGDDIVALYRSDSTEFFPARVIATHSNTNTAEIRFLVRPGSITSVVPLGDIYSRTRSNSARSRHLTSRQRAAYASQPQAWLMLDPTGNEGVALTEYHRQEEAFAAIDEKLGPEVSEPENIPIHAVLPPSTQVPSVATRTHAISQAELQAVLAHLPHQVDSQADVDSNFASTTIHPKHASLMWIPRSSGKPLWLRAFGPSRVVQWSEDEAYSFLAQRMDDVVMNHPLAHHQSSDESTASSCHVHLSLNQRSARAALKATALHREEAIQAIENESQQMIRNNVFSAPMTLEDIPEEYQNDVLRTFLFVVDKYDAGLTYVKSKARIVADGSSQAPHTHGPTASPVMSGFASKLMLAIAARRNLNVASIDIAEAFTQVPYPLKYRCFVRIPRELQARHGHYVELLKCLYGTKNAAREFFVHITKGLLAHGYVQCPYDPAVLRRQDPLTKDYLYLGLHVDDSLIIYSQRAQLEHLQHTLGTIFGEEKVKLETKPSTFLGMAIEYHKDKDISLNQNGYIQAIAQRFKNDLGDKLEIYPHSGDGLKLPTQESSQVPLNDVMRQKYMELIGCLGYATLTRSAIQAQLTYLQSRLANPCLGDWLRALKVLRYLKGTCDYAIRFPGPCSSDATTEEILDRNRLWATVDASYAACVDGRGINAITISLGTYCPPVLVKATKQGAITRSSCESEYNGYGVATQVIMFARGVAGFFHCDISLPTVLENDNQAALTLASSPMIGKGVRHTDVRTHFFKDAILKGIIQPVWRPTDQLLADFPTKPVMGQRFHMLDKWYREGIPWRLKPVLPKQPNSVFDMGLTQGAKEILRLLKVVG